MPHFGHLPLAIFVPFFVLDSLGSWISTFALHFTQYPVVAIEPPFDYIFLRTEGVINVFMREFLTLGMKSRGYSCSFVCIVASNQVFSRRNIIRDIVVADFNKKEVDTKNKIVMCIGMIRAYGPVR